jgi:hypothetical protein
MSPPELAPLHDIQGNTIFCDDVRHEVGGKLIFVGVYTGSLIVRADFPVTLAKFCFNVKFYQKHEVFDPNLSIHIFLPGESDDVPTIEADLQPSSDSRSAVGGDYHMVGANLTFAPFTIKEPGTIKVRILRQGVLHRVGSLNIRKHESTASTFSPPPSEQSPPATPAS